MHIFVILLILLINLYFSITVNCQMYCIVLPLNTFWKILMIIVNYYYYLTFRPRLLVASQELEPQLWCPLTSRARCQISQIVYCHALANLARAVLAASCYVHAQYVHVVCILPECTSAAVLGLCGIMHLGFWTVWLSALDKLWLDNGHSMMTCLFPNYLYITWVLVSFNIILFNYVISLV